MILIFLFIEQFEIEQRFDLCEKLPGPYKILGEGKPLQMYEGHVYFFVRLIQQACLWPEIHHGDYVQNVPSLFYLFILQ